jgi:hypothetical protein
VGYKRTTIETRLSRAIVSNSGADEEEAPNLPEESSSGDVSTTEAGTEQ